METENKTFRLVMLAIIVACSAYVFMSANQRIETLEEQEQFNREFNELEVDRLSKIDQDLDEMSDRLDEIERNLIQINLDQAELADNVGYVAL